MKKSVLLIYLAIITLSIKAQTDTLADLVPLKKGNLWGLVHHDGRQFYKAVFDAIELQDIYRDKKTYVSVFDTDPKTGKPVAEVTFKGLPYILTANKQLLSKAEYEKIRLAAPRKEEVLEDSKVYAESPVPDDKKNKNGDDPYVLLWNERDKIYQTDSAFYLLTVSGKKVMAKKNGKELNWYINGKHIRDFDCIQFYLEFNPHEKKKGYYTGFLLWSGSSWLKGYANLEEEKLTIPFSEPDLYFSEQYPGWIISKKQGVLSLNGKRIGRELPVIKEVVFPGAMALVVEPEPSVQQLYYPLKDSLSSYAFDQIEELYDFKIEYEINCLTEPLFCAKKDTGCGIIRGNGEVVVPLNYDGFLAFSGGVIWVYKDNKWGFFDLKNNFFCVKPVYANKPRKVFRLPCLVKGVPYRLIPIEKDGDIFYVDNFGKEFISK